jgi:hypothetical protein
VPRPTPGARTRPRISCSGTSGAAPSARATRRSASSPAPPCSWAACRAFSGPGPWSSATALGVPLRGGRAHHVGGRGHGGAPQQGRARRHAVIPLGQGPPQHAQGRLVAGAEQGPSHYSAEITTMDSRWRPPSAAGARPGLARFFLVSATYATKGFGDTARSRGASGGARDRADLYEVAWAAGVSDRGFWGGTLLSRCGTSGPVHGHRHPLRGGHAPLSRARLRRPFLRGRVAASSLSPSLTVFRAATLFPTIHREELDT